MPELVVLLRGKGTAAERRRTIDALEANTTDVEVCSCADGVVTNSTLEGAIARGQGVLVLSAESVNPGAADRLAWDVVQRTRDADVVLLDVGGAVGPGWREQLRSAAYADAVIATSSAVPADLLAIHDRSSEHSPLAAADSVHRATALGEPLWGCVYVRRDALNIAKSARWLPNHQQDASPPRLEEVVQVPGLVHVLASAVVVVPVAGRPLHDRSSALTPAARRALAEIEADLETLRVTVDLRCCSRPLSGTQVHALHLVSSLAAQEALRVSVLVPTDVHASVQPYVDALPSSVSRHSAGQRIVTTPHIFHRPYQIFNEREIAEVFTSGVRLVVTHQDMILDRTPAYFASRDQWRHYTAASGLTFVGADEIVFFSEHSRREALRDGLVDESKTSVVPPGTDHLWEARGESMPSALVGRVDSEDPEFVFVIGNSYIHKNRLFALRVMNELSQSHGWRGTTVFAGTSPGGGSSDADEAAFLRHHEELRAMFVNVQRVTDAERRWLYSHAKLVVFPTLYEGFGLIPFEAAAAGTPCVYPSRSSVAEYLPPEGAVLDLGDVPGTARRIYTMLGSSEAGNALVRAILTAGKELTWARTADAHVDIYRRAMLRPIGLSLVSGQEVVVAAHAQTAMSQTERRALVAIRRSTTVRLLTDAVVSTAAAGRRVGQHLSRGRGA